MLSPTRFLIYINDLPDCIRNDSSIFADDSTVYAIGLRNNKESTALSLSADLPEQAASWAKTWGMLFSAEKSDVLTIAGKSKDHAETDVNMKRISMDGVLFPVYQKHKHLGVQINNRLSWSDHVDELYTACARKISICCASCGSEEGFKQMSHKDLYWVHSSSLGIPVRMCFFCFFLDGGGSKSTLCRLHERFCRRHQARLPSLEKRFKYLTLVLFFKITNGLCPTYLSELLTH